MKNSSRLDEKIERNFSRSSIGLLLVERLFQNSRVKLQQAQFAIKE